MKSWTLFPEALLESLSFDDLKFAHLNKYLTAEQVVSLAELALRHGNKDGKVLELAAIIGDRRNRVDDLMRGSAEIEATGYQPAVNLLRKWLAVKIYTAAAEGVSDERLFEIVENYYADHGYPDEFAPLVYYMPAPDSQEASPVALRKRILEFMNDQLSRGS